MEDVPVLRPEQIRLIPERQALVVTENAPSLIAQPQRCLNGRAGLAVVAAHAQDRRRRARCGASGNRDHLI